MRVGFVGDVHIWNHKRFGGAVDSGLNRRCRMSLDALSRSITVAEAQNCDAFVILGDLFDGVKPEPQVLAAVQNILGLPTQVLVLVGNHDQVSVEAGDHALGPLTEVSTVIEQPSVIGLGGAVQLIAIPFRPGDTRSWLPGALADAVAAKPRAGEVRILALHAGIVEEDTPPYLRNAHDAIEAKTLLDLCAEHKIAAVFAGNWHVGRTHSKSPLVVQVGTLAPSGWDDAGWTGRGLLWVYDTKTRAAEAVVIPGPRFAKSEKEIGDNADQRDQVFLRLIAAADDMETAQATLRRLVEAKSVVDGEVLPDVQVAQAAARSAAHAARGAETLTEAVHGYVTMQELTVDPVEVETRVRRYLRL